MSSLVLKKLPSFGLPAVGDYYQAKRAPTKIRCQGYTAPYDPETRSGGTYLGTMGPGTYFGPVEEYLLTDVFVAVLVRGWWINVWKAADGGFPETHFAFKIPEVVVNGWKRRGWYDEKQEDVILS